MNEVQFNANNNLVVINTLNLQLNNLDYLFNLGLKRTNPETIEKINLQFEKISKEFYSNFEANYGIQKVATHKKDRISLLIYYSNILCRESENCANKVYFYDISLYREFMQINNNALEIRKYLLNY